MLFSKLINDVKSYTLFQLKFLWYLCVYQQIVPLRHCSSCRVQLQDDAIVFFFLLRNSISHDVNQTYSLPHTLIQECSDNIPYYQEGLQGFASLAAR